MNELIKELEAATEGSAELDLKVMKALSLAKENSKLTTRVNNKYRGALEFITSKKWTYTNTTPLFMFSRSLDATENALPEGCRWEHMSSISQKEWHVQIEHIRPFGETGIKASDCHIGFHKSLPVARTIALLKAHMEVRDDKDNTPLCLPDGYFSQLEQSLDHK